MARVEIKLKLNVDLEIKAEREDIPRLTDSVKNQLAGAFAPAALIASSPRAPKQVEALEILPENPPVQDGREPQEAAENSEKAKQPRQRRAKGLSVMNLLRDLKEEGFFSQMRSQSEVQHRLEVKGHTCQTSKVTERLKELTKKSELHRSPTGENGAYLYKDSPFYEGNGSASHAGQPTS